ncbi:MAG: SMI1/KNR4 family protein [Acidimicrobiales bacterium]
MSGQVPSRFWDESTDYGVHPALTDDMLADCEAFLGVELPSEYVSLLRTRNGGAVAREFSAFPTSQPTSWAVDHVPFEYCHGIGADGPSIAESPYLNSEWGQPDQLVLLHGGGHYWIALDYRGGRTTEPSVVWFDNEVSQDMTLADSFAAFLAGLVEPPPIDA